MESDPFFELLREHSWLKFAHWQAETESTNSLARQHATERPDLLPALFVAQRQTRGRGRGNHAWWSPDGCLMLTVAVPAALLPADRNQWSKLALLTGVVVAEAIESVCLDLQVQLKWPNDLYLSGRKTGGILIESFAPTGHNQVFLIGVGINFAVDWSMAPRELLDKATCLSSHSGNPASASQLLFQLIEILAGRLNRWILEPRSWHPDWHHRCLLTGRTVTIGLPNGTVGPSALVGTMGNHLTGRCEGVAADGQLLLRTADGKLVSINVGQVVSFE